MNPKILRRMDFGALAFLFLGMLIYNFRPIQALDLGWHLASGRYMAEHRLIPHTDVFSFTCFGRPWVNSYWLQEALLFMVYRIGGIVGLIALKSIGVALLSLGVARGFLRHHSLPVQGLAAFWIFIGAAPRGYGWSEQASMVTLFFLAVLLISLERNRYDLSKINLFFIMAFFMLWANMHRGVLLGLIVLSCCVPVDFIRVIFCFAATLATPWGWHLYQMMSEDLHLSPIHIAGWAATPWKHLEIFWITWVFVIGAWIWGAARHSWKIDPWPRFLISAALAWNSFRYVSQVPYFMIWAVPFLILAVIPTDFRRDVFMWFSRIMLFAAAIFLCAGNRPAAGFNAGIFPVEGCDFIENQNLSGHFFQDYSFGGYWMWRFGSARPVFIDGRYPAVQGYDLLYERLQAAMHGSSERWQAFLSQYSVAGAMVRYPQNSPLALPFATYFPRRLWALVYWDDVDLIFLRRTSANQTCIAKYEFHCVQPDAEPAAIYEHWMHLTNAEKSAWREELLTNIRAHPASRRTRYLLRLLGIFPA